MDTPPFAARFAAVFRSAPNSLPDPFSGATILLFQAPVRCEEALAGREPDRLRVSIEWQAGEWISFTQVSVAQGKARRYAGTVEVLDAPSTKGSRGKLRVDAGQGGNVSGGKIEALVCE